MKWRKNFRVNSRTLILSDMRPDIETINLMIGIAKLVRLDTKIEDGLIKPYISFREAGRKYGVAIVRKWHSDRLIEFLQDVPGGKIRIDRLRLEAVAKSSNRGL